MATLQEPVVLALRETPPMAILKLPVVLLNKTMPLPIAMFA
jgi:hypothetical protein